MAKVQGPLPPVYQVQKENGPEITAIQSELLKISIMLQSQSQSTHEQRPSPSQSGICWYHKRFGSNAKKCLEPCEVRTQPASELWNSLMTLLGTTRLRTSVYHQQPNGLVERFHRHLKGGLKARLAGNHWVDNLPIVLLKEGLSCTSVELVYGTTLRLPEDFFAPPIAEDACSFVSRLHSTMHHQQFIPTTWHGNRDVYLPPDLHSATHIHVCDNGHKPPLTRPCEGPFRVVCRLDEH